MSVRRQRGLTMVEAIILLVILGIVGVAAGVALQGLCKIPAQSDRALALAGKALEKMEELKAMAFDSLTIGTALSDTTTVNGKTYARRVDIKLFDVNGDGTGETDCKQITVTIADRILTTVVTNR